MPVDLSEPSTIFGFMPLLKAEQPTLMGIQPFHIFSDIGRFWRQSCARAYQRILCEILPDELISEKFSDIGKFSQKVRELKAPACGKNRKKEAITNRCLNRSSTSQVANPAYRTDKKPILHGRSVSNGATVLTA